MMQTACDSLLQRIWSCRLCNRHSRGLPSCSKSNNDASKLRRLHGLLPLLVQPLRLLLLRRLLLLVRLLRLLLLGQLLRLHRSQHPLSLQRPHWHPHQHQHQ